jgi:hypothetical protein
VRSVLITALVGCTDGALKSRSRRFLQGLSSDELQFIAEYLGACILESAGTGSGSPSGMALRVAQFQAARAPDLPTDQDHKTILLLEFLRRAGVGAATGGSPS